MKKKRWKINNDTLTSIVIYSLLFCVAVVIAGFIFAWFGRDVSSIVSSALAVFGTELGICGLMKIYDKWSNWQDKREEERRERRKRNG